MWLLKTEPSTWSWDQMVDKETTHWDGVRNFQAAKNLQAMQVGDLCFFYHSGEQRQIMGIVEVIKPYYPDPSDSTGRFGMVDVRAVKPLEHPVTLATIKADSHLQHLHLIRQSRLSVMPIDPPSWEIILHKGSLS